MHTSTSPLKNVTEGGGLPSVVTLSTISSPTTKSIFSSRGFTNVAGCALSTMMLVLAHTFPVMGDIEVF